ncbi:type III-B CRISPR module RAMP protein Cmr4 [Lujinxingia vulgaris]|uniref:Type III-B CRISPR module RAMP protein Cmr4 n=1 Tax=Lujinxingia vulgaris TaxID=2600176 RepID=A0A5C6XCL7_9DELT|nr:RAMP superfamily CRISPR-associated protein [Lujinxingia vulgaris]TXD34816.1 type III-B CRISPR module RAMP protein Cmr4 [Lujinxingia vulgaris]
MTKHKSFEAHRVYGFAVDPIHVGTGGARLGRVDNTIVRDPVTRVPKIPGSSLAGVYRTYVAMQTDGKYPDCAGQGGHCGQPDCPVCMCFGFAKSTGGGFAGLAGFSDAHVVFFPVPTRKGPRWIASPSSLDKPEMAGVGDDKAHTADDAGAPLNLGWLLLPGASMPEAAKQAINALTCVPQHIRNSVVIVTDKLFSHIVNSNLEVRTSVSIDPATGAAEDGALFTYEAIPRGTVLAWDITCRNPGHFKVGGKEVSAATDMTQVFKETAKAHELLKHLGIGGMGTRGMGRLRVPSRADESDSPDASTEGGK